MTDDKEANPMARLAEDAIELAAAGQKAMLDVFAAEMQVFAAMVPAMPLTAEEATAAQARHVADEAEVEAGFDNMPV
ncbi:hypothetical protein LHP98_05305 [Rhodobacter sp. Har01]|uniref:hypothetical protein n=1 Tax=Rhodobacter sp. Har01 TaxID=2883999 RepID=UPI001D0953BB|nr:hypothetical protein [Rhodobacter sp. Har01]MCB6177546.1 hypothetical protein [Rhodobacter sp. Har01]